MSQSSRSDTRCATVRSFVCSFVLCGRQGSSLLWTPALRPSVVPPRQPKTQDCLQLRHHSKHRLSYSVDVRQLPVCLRLSSQRLSPAACRKDRSPSSQTVSSASIPETTPVACQHHTSRHAVTHTFTARRYASAVYAVIVCLFVRPSVCLSATSRNCTETAKRRITQTTPYDRPGNLVF